MNNSENTDVVLLLLYKSIDTETPQQKTPLVRSVEKGQLTITKELLQNGAQTNVYGDKNDSLLHIAIRNEHVEMLKVLLEYTEDSLLSYKNDEDKTVYDISH